MLLFAACSASAIAGNLYISDASLFTVRVFDASSGTLTGTLTPTGGWGSPTGIAVGPNGDVYVADASYNVVDRFSAGGAFLDTFASSGLISPSGLAFGPDQNLYVSDAGFGCADSSVPGGTADYGGYKYDTNGNLLGTFVAPNTLSTPIDLAFGPDGNLYVTDGQSRVARFSGTTGAEMADFIANGGSNGPLINPTFLAFSESSAVPEPATIGIMGLGLAGLAMLRRLLHRRARA